MWENIALVNKRSYEETRSFVREQGIKSAKQYAKWARTNKRPADIPPLPTNIIRATDGRTGATFLGSGSYRGDAFRSYEEMRDAVRAKGMQNQREFHKWAKSRDKPDDIPAGPDRFYRGKGWTTWGEFFGVYYRHKSRWYEKTREFVRKRGIKTQTQYFKCAKSRDKPNDIPSNPHSVYKNKGWTTWGDFLGTDNHNLGKTWPFNKTRNYVRKRGFRTIEQFQSWAKSPARLPGVPSNPNRTYVGKGWTEWGDFLGTGKKPTARASWSGK